MQMGWEADLKPSADVLLGLRLMQMLLSVNSLIGKVNKHDDFISARVLTHVFATYVGHRQQDIH